MFIISKITEFIDYLRYREAVIQANENHSKNGERYYVMPSHDSKGKILLVVMDRRNFRKLKHKNYISNKAKTSDLVSECFYCTPYRNGNGFLDSKGRKLKYKQYLSYCKAQRQLKRKYKREMKAKKNEQKRQK